MLPQTHIPENFKIINQADTLKLRDYSFDYKAKVFRNQKVTKIEALKEWVQKALDTPKGRYIIYSNQYGLALDELIAEHLPPDVFETELKRMIKECLLIHPSIKDIRDYIFAYSGDNAYVSFTVLTDIGGFERRVVF